MLDSSTENTFILLTYFPYTGTLTLIDGLFLICFYLFTKSLRFNLFYIHIRESLVADGVIFFVEQSTGFVLFGYIKHKTTLLRSFSSVYSTGLIISYVTILPTFIQFTNNTVWSAK